MFRSFISSFKRLLTAAGLLALALLLAVEFLAVRSGWIWSATPQSATGAFDALERHVIAKSARPAVVFFGSSRMRDAIMPRRLAKAAGLAPASVMNLGITTGNPFDAVRFYQRNRDRLKHSCIFVVGIEDWYLNGESSPTHRDRRFATLGERLNEFPSQFRLSLLAGWIFRTYDARALIQSFLWTRTLSIFTGDDPSRVWLTEDGRIRWRSAETETGPDVDPEVGATADGLVRGYTKDGYLFRALRRFIDLARSDGVRVLVTRVPLRQTYLDYIAARHSGFLRAYEAETASLRNAEILQRDEPSGWGLVPGDFYDYGHLALRGARKYSERFGRLLKTEYSETLSASRCRPTERRRATGR